MFICTCRLTLYSTEYACVIYIFENGPISLKHNMICTYKARPTIDIRLLLVATPTESIAQDIDLSLQIFVWGFWSVDLEISDD